MKEDEFNKATVEAIAGRVIEKVVPRIDEVLRVEIRAAVGEAMRLQTVPRLPAFGSPEPTSPPGLAQIIRPGQRLMDMHGRLWSIREADRGANIDGEPWTVNDESRDIVRIVLLAGGQVVQESHDWGWYEFAEGGVSKPIDNPFAAPKPIAPVKQIARIAPAKPPRPVAEWLLRERVVAVPETLHGIHAQVWPLSGLHESNDFAYPITSPEPNHPFTMFRTHGNAATVFLELFFPNGDLVADWTRGDATIDAIRAKGSAILLCVFGQPTKNASLPGWRSKGFPGESSGGYTSAPHNWNIFRQQIELILTRYKPEMLECWNEPDLKWRNTEALDWGPAFWVGSTLENAGYAITTRRREMARMQSILFDAARTFSPNTLVLSPGFVWWEGGRAVQADLLAYLKTDVGDGREAGECMDAISAHHYDKETAGTVRQFTDKLFQMIATRDAYTPKLRLVMSETGLLDGTGTDSQRHALRIQRQFIVGAALGFETVCVYGHDCARETANGYDRGGNGQHDKAIQIAYGHSYARLHGRHLHGVAVLDDGSIFVETDQAHEVV